MAVRENMNISLGDGAYASAPSADQSWQARYAPSALNRFDAAMIFDSYHYLIMECTKEEAWRRIKLMRAVVYKTDQEDGVSHDR